MTNATKTKQGRRPPPPSKRDALRRTWIGLGVLAGVVILAAMFFSGGDDGDGFAPSAAGTVTIDREATTKLASGEPIPDFEAPELEGGTIAWADQVGRPTVLAIWAPWCPHCQAELPRLAAALENHPDVQLVTITTAYGAQPGPTPGGYMADEGLSFPVAVDDDAGTLMQGFGVSGFPTTYYVASDGTVVTSTEGEVDPAELESILSDLEAR
jgi:cytochrome c biogenesis protein CcmG/thiol:disulfide interchange protein DsbE